MAKSWDHDPDPDPHNNIDADQKHWNNEPKKVHITNKHWYNEAYKR